MDEKLKAALDTANYMVTYNNQREMIKQEIKELLLYHENGHRFTINRELINFLNTVINMGHDEMVILDDFENPYMVDNTKKFLENIFGVYVESSNSYYYKFTELKKNRSIEKIVGV